MDNIKNGYDFLANNKFDDAINAFSNAISADSKDIEAHFGLSQAYYFLYKETNINSYRNTAKDHANICINLNPQHPQSYAAKSFLSLINDDNFNKNTTNTTKKLAEKHAQTTYDKSHQQEQNLLISSQKDFIGNLNKENTDNSSVASAVKTFFGFGCITSFLIIGVIIFSLTKMSNLNDKVKELTTNIELPIKTTQKFSGATISDKGVVVWVIYEKKGGKGFVQYTNINGKALSKKIYLMDNITDVFEYNNIIYVLGGRNNEKVEARNMTTGEILFDAQFLKQKYPELNIGIGKIKPFQTKGFEIVTKKGDQFYYLFVNQKLYSAAEKKQLESSFDTNSYVAQYLWYTQDKETVKKTYFLAKTLENPFWIDINTPKNILPVAETLIQINGGKSSNEFQKFPTTTKTFLEGNLVYGDQEYAIIAHKNAIDVNHHTVYTCIEAKTGNIIWEKTSEKNLLFNIENENTTSHSWKHNKKSRYNDLVLFYLNSPKPSLVIIDIKTGKITLEKSNLF